MGENRNARVCLGAIAGAFGVRGEVRIKPFTQNPEDVAAYGPVETEDGGRRFEIKPTRAVKGGLAARLSGVASREQAEALKGVRFYVERAALPDPGEEEEYYHADLIGLAVEDLQGEPLGKVAAVWDFGAGDVLEIARSHIKPGAKNAFLPFTKAMAPHVDLAGGKIVADPPEGLLDESAQKGSKKQPEDEDASGEEETP